MFRKLGLMLFAMMMVVALVPAGADAGNGNGRGKDDNGYESTTTVPGHQGRDGYVNGHYTSIYAYDETGAWYQDLGDGRIRGTVGSVDELADESLTVCEYVVNYRGDFGGDPSLDEGWIQNHINCSGYDDNGTYNYLIVHQTDPRYTGDSALAIWGTWEYHVYTVSGEGNIARPMKASGAFE